MSRRAIALVLMIHLFASAGCKLGRDGAPKTVGALAGGSFEGEIELVVKQATFVSPKPMRYEIRGDKVRFDVHPDKPGAEAAYAVVDTTSQKSFMVIDQQQTAMVLELAQVQRGLGQSSDALGPPTIEKRAQTGRVAGYECKIWQMRKADHQATACVLEGLRVPALLALGKFGSELGDGNVFPLRLVERDSQGVEISRLEVTSIEAKKLDEKRFVIPEGYRQLDALGMMQQLGTPTNGVSPR